MSIAFRAGSCHHPGRRCTWMRSLEHRVRAALPASRWPCLTSWSGSALTTQRGPRIAECCSKPRSRQSVCRGYIHLWCTNLDRHPSPGGYTVRFGRWSGMPGVLSVRGRLAAPVPRAAGFTVRNIVDRTPRSTVSTTVVRVIPAHGEGAIFWRLAQSVRAYLEGCWTGSGRDHHATGRGQDVPLR